MRPGRTVADAHGSAHSNRGARHRESPRALAKRYGINEKTVPKWKQRGTVTDLPTGPKETKSTVLSIAEKAIIVAFRRHTLLPLDDCVYALQPAIPHLTRSSLHRCLQRHGISQLPEVEGGEPSKKKFKACPLGYFHIDIAELQTAEGKLYLYVAIDRTSKFAFVQPASKTGRLGLPRSSDRGRIGGDACHRGRSRRSHWPAQAPRKDSTNNDVEIDFALNRVVGYPTCA
ncbi:transposase [Bradyrhizobium niftali]